MTWFINEPPPWWLRYWDIALLTYAHILGAAAAAWQTLTRRPR